MAWNYEKGCEEPNPYTHRNTGPYSAPMWDSDVLPLVKAWEIAELKVIVAKGLLSTTPRSLQVAIDGAIFACLRLESKMLWQDNLKIDKFRHGYIEWLASQGKLSPDIGFGKKISAPASMALLLDTSGSMMGSPIQKLRELAQEFVYVRRFEFNSTCRELGKWEEIGDATGSTQMGAAFKYVKNVGIDHIVLITDGDPDSETHALQESVGLKIDIYYVGPEPAPHFLAALANQTGGKYGTATLDDIKQLTETIRLGLPSPSSTKETINL